MSSRLLEIHILWEVIHIAPSFQPLIRRRELLVCSCCLGGICQFHRKSVDEVEINWKLCIIYIYVSIMICLFIKTCIEWYVWTICIYNNSSICLYIIFIKICNTWWKKPLLLNILCIVRVYIYICSVYICKICMHLACIYIVNTYIYSIHI